MDTNEQLNSKYFYESEQMIKDELIDLIDEMKEKKWNLFDENQLIERNELIEMI